MSGLVQDLRYAVRQLRKTPGFACTVIVILALGIGSTTAIFSTINPILLEPLPYPQARRIVMIWYAGEDGSRIPQTFHTYRELAERSRSLEAITVLKPWQPALTGADHPERFDGQRVSANYFHALGVPPALGRDFQPSDDVYNGPKVVILGNELWQRTFAGDRSIIGRQVRLDDDNYTVIGVMPRMSTTCWLLRRTSGRPSNMTRETSLLRRPESGVITCGWSGDSVPASA